MIRHAHGGDDGVQAEDDVEDGDLHQGGQEARGLCSPHPPLRRPSRALVDLVGALGDEEQTPTSRMRSRPEMASPAR